ncbi:MAG: HD domain-containing phosphohydrolase [Bacillota bacterium]
MEGLFLGQNGRSFESVQQKTAKLDLLARGDGTEIMTQHIQPDQLFKLFPSDSSETMEFFYVLEGQISSELDGQTYLLQPGDYFYAHHLQGTAYFRTLTPVTVLYISTQPIFHYLSDRIRELTSMVKSVEQKDVYTLDHSRRVREYSVAMGMALGLSRERQDVLLHAALFHDLGKKSIPDEILNKPGRLTADEMEHIRRHPIDGKDLVAGTFLRDIGKIIEQHHERLDGSGYPSGLMGDEIVVEARIIAVADSYDAMTTARPYRGPMTPEEALDELKKLSGIAYDARAVAAFEQYLIEKGVVSKEPCRE